MPPSAIRSHLHKLIDSIQDENILQAVQTILSNQNNIIGYSVQGEPLTEEKLKAKVKAASQRVKNGKFTPHVDVKKQAEQW